jgi:hypothetical protein
VDTKGEDVPDGVLTAIDRAVHFPIIFEVARPGEDKVRMVAAQKLVGGGVPKLGPYFTTDWMRSDSVRAPLPPAIDLSSLYAVLLISLFPIAVRSGETLPVLTDRMERIRILEREVAALEKKLRAEPQFNRKVELRRQLEKRNTLLGELTTTAKSS